RTRRSRCRTGRGSGRRRRRLLPPALLRAATAPRLRGHPAAGFLLAHLRLELLLLVIVVVLPLAAAFFVLLPHALALGPLPLQCLRSLDPSVEDPPHLVVERELPRLLRGGRRICVR